MCDTFPLWSLQSTLEMYFLVCPQKCKVLSSKIFKHYTLIYKNCRRLKNQSRLDANPSQAQSSANHTLSYTLT